METRERERDVSPTLFYAKSYRDKSRFINIISSIKKIPPTKLEYFVSRTKRKANSFRNLLQKEKCHGVGGASCRNARVEGVNISRATAV